MSAALALLSFPASAGFPIPQAMKCPVGSKSFTHTTTGSYSIWGYRPDGKPYGSWDFPMQLPKCPGSGLVIFDDFTNDDVKRLEALVESAEYRAIRDKETNYYLAAWLMERLGRLTRPPRPGLAGKAVRIRRPGEGWAPAPEERRAFPSLGPQPSLG